MASDKRTGNSGTRHRLPRICAGCFISESDATLFFCADCREKYYCSSACQKKMWKDHKVLCRRNTAMKEENGGNESAWYMSNNRLIHEALAQGLRFDRSFDMASTHFVHVILTSRPHHRRSKRYIVQSLTVEPIELAEELLIRNQEYDPDSVTRQGLWQGTDFLGALAVLTFRNSKGKSGNLLTPRTFYQKAKYSYNPNWRRCIMQAAAET